MSDFVTSADGTRIAYDRFGEGPAVVLVAGATKSRASDPAATELAQAVAANGFTAVVYDRRGRGESTDTLPYAVAREVEDLKALVGAVGGSATLYGTSSGAVLALWAAQAGIGVERLLLWEPPLTPDDDGQDFLLRLRERLAAKDREGAIAVFMGDVQEEWLEALRQSPAYPAIWNLAHTLAYDAEVLADALTGTPWSEQWSSVTVPTLVMVTEPNLPVVLQSAHDLAQALPHAATRRFTEEQLHHRVATMTATLTKALQPGPTCPWPCPHCGAALREAARAAEEVRPYRSGPVPLYDEA